MATIAVIGGGIIGSTIAIELIAAGHTVQVYDPFTGPAANYYAAGMLSAYPESWLHDERAITWAQAALACWMHWIDSRDLHSIVAARTTVLLARSHGDTQELSRFANWLSKHSGIDYEPRGDLSARYPYLNTAIHSGIELPEYAVDNRGLMQLLHHWLAGKIHQGECVDTAPWDQIIYATGMDMATRFPHLGIYGMQGEILRLVRPQHSHSKPPEVVIRGLISGRNVYLVPRKDGVVVGATEYESTDRKPQASGVWELLGDAFEIMPQLRDYQLSEAAACIRPMRPDSLPWVGRMDSKTLIAAGHGRNGFLYAPLTAQRIVQLIDDEQTGRRDLVTGKISDHQ